MGVRGVKSAPRLEPFPAPGTAHAVDMLSTRFGGETSDLVRYAGLHQFGRILVLMRESDFRDAEAG